MPLVFGLSLLEIDSHCSDLALYRALGVRPPAACGIFGLGPGHIELVYFAVDSGVELFAAFLQCGPVALLHGSGRLV
ncbi:MAG: hypothetical protein WAL26_10010 [Mycobacterium sp.]